MNSEEELVQLLADKSVRLEATRLLLGGVTASELRSVRPTEAAFQALLCGLLSDDDQVRWWSVQLLDHCADPRSVTAIAPLLDDHVPRIRRIAAHALGCVICKPEWSGELPVGTIERLTDMAESDPNQKVRTEATLSLSCRSNVA
jgi:hypothetical protein